MLVSRLLVAIVLLPIGLLAIHFGGFPYNLLVTLLLVLAAWEYVLLFRLGGLQPAGFLIPAGTLLLALGRMWDGFLSAPWLLSLLILVSMTYHLLAYERGDADAAVLLAEQRGLLTPDNQVRLTLVLDTQDSAALVTELKNLGVNVRGTYRDLIDISIPVELIVQTARSDNPGQVFDQITQLEHVIGLQLPQTKFPNTDQSLKADDSPPFYLLRDSRSTGALIGPVVSEGVKFLQANVWQAAGYTGRNIKIGVLDQGFDGYKKLLGRELPITVEVKSFVPGFGVDETGINHGTAVAEIIHAVAPDAALYFAYYDGGDVSMGNAVDWLVSQGVQIISHSAGGMAAPMDGTGRDAEIVNQLAQSGILWVNSAGNGAQEHYRGLFSAANTDGVHAFAPDKTLLGFQSIAGATTQIILTWDDWKTTDPQTVNLFLLDDQGNVLASARNTREGGQPPVQQIIYKFDQGRTFFVTIQGTHVTRPLRLDLFVHPTENMQLSDPAGSLASPGDAIGSLTIGAVNWRDSSLEPFSARGPTADGRIKPDLVGPDGVSTGGSCMGEPRDGVRGAGGRRTLRPMADVTIYHNPNCSTSKHAVATAAGLGADAEIVVDVPQQHETAVVIQRNGAEAQAILAGHGHKTIAHRQSAEIRIGLGRRKGDGAGAIDQHATAARDVARHAGTACTVDHELCAILDGNVAGDGAQTSAAARGVPGRVAANASGPRRGVGDRVGCGGDG